MSVTTAARGFVLFLLTVPVIQGQKAYDVKYTSTEICGLRGSTVDMSCTYTYPRRVGNQDTTVQESFWFIRESNGICADLKSEPDYSGRVEYLCDNNRCTLTIKDLRESDAALYKFRFITNQSGGSFTGLPGVTLSVTDLQVQVDTLHEYQFYSQAKLTCQSSCLPDHSSFIWYKGQSKATEGATYSDYFYSSDSISCAVKGHESFHSPSVLIQRQKGYDVKYTSTEICGFRGSTVDISCTYTYPRRVGYHDTTVQKTFWFIKESNEIHADLKSEPDYSGRVENLCDNNRCTLTIKDLRESDAALYKFRFTTNQSGGSFTGSPGVTLSVRDPQLQINVRSLDHYSPWKELTCHSSCQLPDDLSYVWYNNGQKVRGKTKYLHLRVFSPTDSYHCEHGSIRSPPVYAPKLPSVSVSPSGVIVEGSSVTLNCSADANPEATCIWYKNQTLIKGAERIYRLSPISSEDRGRYDCSCQNLYGTTTTSKYVHVQYAPKSPSVSVSPSGLIVEGSSVTLTCSADANPAANYTWYKENTHAHAQLLREFVFTSIQSSDSGLYRCVARNELGESPGNITVAVEYAPKLPSVSVSPSGVIVEGSSVTLNCSADANPEATCIWYKNQTLIKGAERIYRLSPISSEDRGLYECSCQNLYGTTRTSKYLHVQYAPKSPSVSVSPSGQIVEGSSVTLTCSSDANPEATCIWYKNQTLIKGAERIYRLSSISSEDRGLYECSCQNLYGTRRTSKYVDVLYAPKLPSVSVSPSGQIVEGSSVTLTCSADANPAATYTWYKDNEDSVKATGHNFTITDIRPEHGGQYYCKVKNTRGSQRAMFSLDVTVSTEVLKTAITGTTTAVLFVMVLLTIIFLMRKKRTSEQPSEPGDRANHSEQLEEVVEPHYVSVHFVKKQTDAIYSNIQPGPHRNMMKQRENEEDVVEYSAVKFRSRGQETVEDPTALYSVVKKPTH
ncbi:B-cell receptor CD22-like [Solea solea]|uniref:B-cell receptor CD22-like n=1 Tax=Solea solea TaxID=90069 RepID=UPI00272D56D9|nr:B-cell receptor CD22-like [Solea solea]